MEHLRLIIAGVMVTIVRSHVLLSPVTDFEDRRNFKPDLHHTKELHAMLYQWVDQIA